MTQREPDTHAELRELVGDEAGVELRPMFGTLAALVDGHVFSVATADAVGVKLGPEALDDLGALPGSGMLMMGRRRMSAYRALPPDLPAGERRAWLRRARDHVSGLHH
ncbi:TfoX/Sxy family protein [Terrabacter carboxydivorans]|uniref:TfoX/Sxy family protein n=1 Tax=Terrabacter carboxydivorans TaxID=619730 RepID=UPI0031E1473D